MTSFGFGQANAIALAEPRHLYAVAMQQWPSFMDCSHCVANAVHVQLYNDGGGDLSKQVGFVERHVIRMEVIVMCYIQS